jgi:hypothetical protein
LKKVIRHSEIETKGKIYTQTLVYADDIVLVGTSIDALKQTMKKLVKAGGVMGLIINMLKTECTEVTKKSAITETLKIYDQEYEWGQ